MEKVIRIGKGKWGNVYCNVKWNDRRLSITGVEGPMRNGDARGGCGQIDPLKSEITEFAPGWNQETLEKFAAIWERWHLNDMRAGNAAQEKALREWKEKGNAFTYEKAVEYLKSINLYEVKISLDGVQVPYKYGYRWLTEEVPQEVIDWLFNLPETDMTPAWV